MLPAEEVDKSPARIGVGFLGLSLTAILFLTMMPMPEWQWQPEKRFDSCILCTRGAVPDFLENILLFLPLGAALAIRRYRLWSSVLCGGLLSLAIEIAQFVVPGRDPSLQDIICNTLGVFIGFGIAHSSLGPLLAQVLGWCREIWEQWKRPTPTLANVLIGGTILALTGVFIVTGWLLQPAFPLGPYLFTGQKLDEGSTPLRIGANGDQDGFFKGVIDEVRIYSRALIPQEILADMTRPIGNGSPSFAPDLVAAYGFDEGGSNRVLDASGHGNSGLLEGAERVAGRFGKALKFDGQGAQVILPQISALNLRSGFTLEAWIRPEPSASSWPAVIQKGRDLYFLYAGADGALVPSGGGTFGGANEGVNAPEPLAYGSWSHLAASYDGSALRMYVNGHLVAHRVRWFQGRIDRMSVDNIQVRPGLIDTRWLTEVLKTGGMIRLSGTAGLTTGNKGPLLDIRNNCNGCADQDILLLAAYRNDLVLQSFTVASTLGLPSPEIRFHGALKGINAGSPLTIALSGMAEARSLNVNGATYREPGFSLGRGWSVLVYSQYLPEWLGEFLNLAWLAAWTFPVGFWARTRRVLLGATVLLGGVIWWLPAVGMFAPTPPIQWVAAILGLVMGIGVRYWMVESIVKGNPVGVVTC